MSYKNPPVKEVGLSVEFNRSDPEWVHFAEKFFHQNEDRFTREYLIENNFTLDMSNSIQPKLDAVSIRHVKLFAKKDEPNISSIFIGQNKISAQMLRGKQRIPQFHLLHNDTMEYIQQYAELLNRGGASQDFNIVSASISYVDEIRIPSDSTTVNLNDYFTFPVTPSGDGFPSVSFIDSRNVFLPVPSDPKKTLHFRIVSVYDAQKPYDAVFRLFWNFITKTQKPITLQETFPFFDEMHGFIRKYFEMFLTDLCKDEIFGRE